MEQVTEAILEEFQSYLVGEERSPGSIEKYMRDIRNFAVFLKGRAVTKGLAAEWKEQLLTTRMPRTVNAMLAAVNALLRFAGREDCRVKYLKLQRQVFRSADRELSRQEYERLLQMARVCKKQRLALLMETICSTGIRVSEVKYITVEAAKAGHVTVSLKGKIRVILLPGKLCRKLLKYAAKQKTVSGEIFLTRNGNSLSRKQIWTEMKALCKRAQVESSKVFPHNLRHLFARTFYKSCKDVVQLADVLGHSSIETTRIYLVSTGEEHRKRLERLGLIS